MPAALTDVSRGDALNIQCLMVPRTLTAQVLGCSAWAPAVNGHLQPLLGVSQSLRWG